MILPTRRQQGKGYRQLRNLNFNEASIRELYDKMHPLKTEVKPFGEQVDQRTKVSWITPKLVCEVWYAEWTADGHLRQPVYKGLRMDKDKEEVVMEMNPGQAAGR